MTDSAVNPLDDVAGCTDLRLIRRFRRWSAWSATSPHRRPAILLYEPAFGRATLCLYIDEEARRRDIHVLREIDEDRVLAEARGRKPRGGSGGGGASPLPAYVTLTRLPAEEHWPQRSGGDADASDDDCASRRADHALSGTQLLS